MFFSNMAPTEGLLMRNRFIENSSHHNAETFRMTHIFQRRYA